MKHLLSFTLGLSLIGCGAKKPAMMDDLAMLSPKDDVVVTVDMPRIRSSDMYKGFAPMLNDALAKSGAWLTACGNPAETITKVVIGADMETNTSAAVVHGYTAANVATCFSHMRTEGHDVNEKGDQAVVKIKGEAGAVGVVVQPDGTFVVYMANEMNHETIAKARAAGGLAPALRQGLAAVDEVRAVRFYANKAAFKGDETILHAAGWLDVTANMTADVMLGLADADTAKKVASEMAAQVGMVKGMMGVSKLDVTAEGAALRGQLEASKEELEKAMEMFKTFAQ